MKRADVPVLYEMILELNMLAEHAEGGKESLPWFWATNAILQRISGLTGQSIDEVVREIQERQSAANADAEGD